jgi:hypothetical protein
MHKVTENHQRNNTSLPDLAYIRQNIPIEEVWSYLADECGLEPVNNHMARCFRPEAHQNGDRTPSLHFSKNNKCKCQSCDSGPYYSNLDLVQKVWRCDLREAIRWFSCHWEIPTTRPGRPAGTHKPVMTSYRVGRGGPLEAIVRSGLFGEMSFAAGKLLTVLAAVQDEHNECDWSYPSLQRAAGIASSDTLHTAIEDLRGLHILTVGRAVRPGERNAHNVYRLTLDHPELAGLISSTYRANQYANSEERRLRTEARKNRDHHAKSNQYSNKDN